MGLSKILPHPSTSQVLQLSGKQMSAWTCSKLLQITRLASPSPKNTPPKHLEYDKWHVIDYLENFPSSQYHERKYPANMRPSPTPSPQPRCINTPPLYGHMGMTFAMPHRRKLALRHMAPLNKCLRADWLSLIAWVKRKHPSQDLNNPPNSSKHSASFLPCGQ